MGKVRKWGREFDDAVIQPVVGGVKSVVNFVLDDVVSPIVNTIGNVIETALDNPVKTLAQIAAIVTQQYWALPLIEGADVAAKGGDLGDVLEATAKAYIAGELGSMAGNAIGSYVSDAAFQATYGVTAGSQQAIQLAAQEAGMNTASQLAGRVAGSAARSATTAAVLGQDVGKALVTGGVSAAVPAALGQIDGYSSLPPTVQAVLSQTITAGLLGGNVTNAAITSLITSANVAAGAVKNLGGTPAQQAIATDLINGTMIAALTGRNVSAAQQAVLMQAGANALGKAIGDGFKKASTAVGDKTAAAKATADKMDDNIAKQEAAAADYNKYADAANGIVAEQNRLKSAYDSALAAHNANPSQATADAVNASAKAFNDYVTDANARYSRDIKPGLDQANNTLAGLQNEFNMLEPVYAAGVKDIEAATSVLQKELAPVTQAVEKAVVTTLDPNFNEAQYKALNGVPPDENAFSHWLTKGQFENAVTNDAAAEFYFNAEKTRLLLAMAEANGISITQINQQDTQNFFNAIEAKYGDNLKALSSASLQDVMQSKVFGQASRPLPIDHYLKSSRANNFATGDVPTYGAWNATDTVRNGLPSGTQLASAADVANDRAVIGYTADGRPVWLTHAGGLFDMPESGVGDSPIRYMKNPDTGEMEPVYYGGTLNEVVVTAPRLKNEDPGAYITTIGGMPDAATAGISDYLYNFAKGVMDLAKRSNNSTIINTAGNVLKAGGGVLQAFNGLVVLANKNPTTTSVGKFADKLINLGKATTTEEYRAAVADMNQIMKGGKGVIGTAKAIWGAATSYPAEFLAEIVGVEAMQELVPLVIGGGAATAARGLAMARGMGTTVAAQWGARAGISAGAASDIAESVGGAAEGAFNEAYKVAIARGMSEADATNTALQIAARTGIVSGVVTAGTLGIGGMALEKAILGKAGSGELAGAIDALTATVKRGGSITLKEGVTEGIESGVTEAFKEGQLLQLDPTRDVSGNITSAVILGAIAGGGIAGGTYGAARTGDIVSNALIVSNPQVIEAVNNAASPAAATAALQNLGINDAKVQTNLLDTKYDSAYTSTAEARAALAARPDYVPTDADVDAFVGATPDSGLGAKVEQYVDQRVFDIGEVKAAAAAEGYNISDADAAKLVGQKDEAAATAAARAQFDPLATDTAEATQFFANIGYNPTAAEVQQFVGSKSEADQTKAVTEYVNPRQVTEAEARKYLTDLGYNPTDAEVRTFVGQVNEADQAKKITEYADPRVVDAEEVKAAYKTLGLEQPTTADIQKLVGQYAEADLSGKAKTNLETARFNTLMERVNELGAGADAETKAAIDLIKKDLEAQIDSVGGKVADLSKTVGSAANLPTQEDGRDALKVVLGLAPYDAKYDWDGDGKVTHNDAINMVKAAAGVETSTPPASITPWGKASGVYAELDAVQKDVLDKAAQYEKDGIARDAAITKAVEDVAKDLGTTKEAIGNQIGAPATTDVNGKPVAATGVYKAIADNAASVQKNVLDKVAEYEAAGATRDAAITKAVEAVAKDLGTTKEAIGNQIGAPATTDASGKPVEATGVYKAIADSAAASQADAQAKYNALSAGQKQLADDLIQQGADLGGAIATVEANVKLDAQAKYDALSAGQKQLADDLAKQGVDLGVAIETAAASARTDAQNKFNALDAGQKQLAADLVKQGSDLGSAIATVEANVRADAQTKYDALTAGQKKIADDLVRQGVTLSAAINTAVSTATETITADVQTKYDALSAGQKKLTDDLVKQGVDLNTAIRTAQTELGGRIGGLETTLGTPGRTASRSDLDEIINILNTQGAYDPRYDYNANGRIDPEDRDAIANYLGGTTTGPFTPGAGTVWAPSGIYGTMAQNQAALEKKIADEAEATRAANAARTDAAARASAASALKTQRMGNLNTMMGLLAQPNAMGGQRAAPAAPPESSKIGYVYDFSSIFANPAQEKLFVNPYGGYAQGGTVRSEMDDVNDELLKILKG